MAEEQMKKISSELSNKIDELVTYTRMLDEMTHSEAECGTRVEEILRLVDKIEKNVQITKIDYREIRDIMKKRQYSSG